MLDAFIIEELAKLKKRREIEERPALEIQVPEDQHPSAEDEDKSTVIVIDI